MPDSASMILFSGHMTDDAGRKTSRFPEHLVPAARTALSEALQACGAGPDTLCLCGGARGGDLLFAEEAVALGAPVSIYLPMPRDAFLDASVRTDLQSGINWERHFSDMCDRACEVTVLDPEGPWPGDNVFAKNNLRMLDAAQTAAEGASFALILLWDGKAGDGAGGTADMAERAENHGAHVEIIAPAQL